MVVEMRVWMQWRSCGEGGLVIARGRRIGEVESVCCGGKGVEEELGSCMGQDGGGDALLFVGTGCGATGAVGRWLSAQNQPIAQIVVRDVEASAEIVCLVTRS